VLVLWAAATVVFFGVAAGGSQVDAILGPQAANLPGLRAQAAAEFGLDRPLLEQYASRIGGYLVGDLGVSYQRRVPVADILADQIGPTLQLAGSAAVTGVVVALLLTWLTAGRGRVVRATISFIEVLAVSVPAFWLGLVLLSVFSFSWRLFPAYGSGGPLSLVLPTLTLAIPIGAVLSQVMRRELQRAEDAPFTVSARSRGIAERGLYARHTLRHALLPVVTLAAWALGALVGGAVLVERVFSRPGLGQVLVEAVRHRDTPVVSAVVLLAAVAFVVVSALVDVVYPLVDPRTRTRSAA
jgi:peptide/nickel transport system permease protein